MRALVRWAVLLVWVLVSGLVVSGAMVPRAEAAVGQEALQRAIHATVYIKADRRFHGQDISSFGSGFFVSEGGFILTNRHVISDTIEGNIWDEDHEISVTVIRLTVVVDAGAETERELPATIVAQDRKRDLALLKVGYRAEHFLEPQGDVLPGVTEEVFAIGYPFGEYLAMDEEAEPMRGGNPEPSVSVGRVTSIRRDSERNVVAIQTDAAINPGNSGGPLLDTEGRLVGVVFSKMTGGDQVGFAIPSNRVWEFFVQQAVRVSFKPPFVFEPRVPIEVMVRPGVYPLAAVRGTVRISGGDIEPVQVSFERSEDGWTALVDVPEARVGLDEADSYAASIQMFGRDHKVLLERRYRLPRKGDSRGVVASRRDPASLMEDRKIFANELSIDEYAQKVAAEREAREGSAAGATSATGQGSEDGAEGIGEGLPGAELSDEERTALAQRLVERGRELLREDQARQALRVLAEAVELAPENELAAGFLELAAEKVRLLSSAGPVEDRVDRPTTDSGTAQVYLLFDAPFKKGRLVLELDGSPLEAVPFQVSRARSRRGARVEQMLEVPAGRHTVTVSLEDAGDKVLGTETFDEQLDPGSAWTLRVTMARESDPPSFFLVLRR